MRVELDGILADRRMDVAMSPARDHKRLRLAPEVLTGCAPMFLFW